MEKEITLQFGSSKEQLFKCSCGSTEFIRIVTDIVNVKKINGDLTDNYVGELDIKFVCKKCKKEMEELK